MGEVLRKPHRLFGRTFHIFMAIDHQLHLVGLVSQQEAGNGIPQKIGLLRSGSNYFFQYLVEQKYQRKSLSGLNLMNCLSIMFASQLSNPETPDVFSPLANTTRHQQGNWCCAEGLLAPIPAEAQTCHCIITSSPIRVGQPNAISDDAIVS